MKKTFFILTLVTVFIGTATYFGFWINTKRVAEIDKKNQKTQEENKKIQEENEKQKKEEMEKKKFRNWSFIGKAGFTVNRTSYIRTAYDEKNKIIYIAFKDETTPNIGKLSVLKLQNDVIQSVGVPQFTPVNIYFLDMALDPISRLPYVIYAEDLGVGSHKVGEGETAVWRFNGSNWEKVGEKITGAFSAYRNASIGFDPIDNQPYCSYYESLEQPMVVKKFDGQNWQYAMPKESFQNEFIPNQNNALSNLIFSPEDGSGIIAYSVGAKPSFIHVMKMDEFSWKEILTSPGLDGFLTDIKLTANPYDKNIYISFNNFYNSGETSSNIGIAKIQDNNFYYIGEGNFPDGAKTAMSDVVYNKNNGNIYLAYSSDKPGALDSVMKYNGSAWNNLGSPRIMNAGGPISLVTTENNEVYAVFQDFDRDAKMSIMKIIDSN